MATPLNIWAEQASKAMGKIGTNKMDTQVFFRDPVRTLYCDHDSFFSPADGIIMYQKIVQGDQDLMEIKGVHYKAKDIFLDEVLETAPFMVISIFMTYLSVHVNRCPTSALLKFRYLEPILSYNIPMLFTDLDIRNHEFLKAYNNMNYLKYNARMLNTFYIPQRDYKYFLTQIADEDVNTITPFTADQNQYFHQNQRFSFVRWGSQAELILPMDHRYKFEQQIPDKYYVRAGIDRLVRIV